MASPTHLAEQAKLMEAYGAHCVNITDSGGQLAMNDVRARMRAYRGVLDPEAEIGIHAHQNLSLYVANSVLRSRKELPGSTPPWPARGRSGQHPHRSVHRRRRPDRMEAQRSSVEVAGLG
ncbi:4-hyroxy-2-oxovalerate/4-hydroxy-2-oxopentanoic acid aldolase [Rhodococcus wratislaviensis IFP 2016]|nr:4-hyroxy-2-oxovalerate/4-hydroxy-2-oxopentanoic acid aldolase [Rhodococcus wratislaviensis IFP 2016]